MVSMTKEGTITQYFCLGSRSSRKGCRNGRRHRFEREKTIGHEGRALTSYLSATNHEDNGRNLP